jgi:hypothetical protein
MDRSTTLEPTSSDPQYYDQFGDWRGGALLVNRKEFIKSMRLENDLEGKPKGPAQLTEGETKSRRSYVVHTLVKLIHEAQVVGAYASPPLHLL